MPSCNVKRRKLLRRISISRPFFRGFLFWDRILGCCLGKSIGYRQLTRAAVSVPTPGTDAAVEGAGDCRSSSSGCRHGCNGDSNLVSLKISVFGDSQIGKTSFLMKYGGNEKYQGEVQKKGLNLMAKTQCVKGAHISYSIWEVEGDEKSQDHIPIACEDSVAMLFMFDLTSRCTLNSVITWYKEARKWNKRAIPILIGAKFDDFIQLPLDLQWTIASQARAYAKVLNATLFFSSATYNINVNKIFKFMTAKLFNLPWTVERNLTPGEPIIDF